MAYSTDPDHVTLYKLQRSAAADSRWAKETDRTAAMSAAHAGRDRAIAVRAGIFPDGGTVAEFQERLRADAAFERQFESARKWWYTDMARRRQSARIKAKKALAEVERVEVELHSMGGDAA